ncbi:hypothetical protein KUTeg_021846 [Tegillarca granosa]|uniref:Sushi, von Willebrand factor type A, EGF and pentraxin domain-containing protein 1 n=1 Tax=Tegillarca granosa TaxID=220873 RepID=A0ABQ9E9V7_TEGGR|nr:hypothetical protein KUTeg_021846 [Tegillarca granosa]
MAGFCCANQETNLVPNSEFSQGVYSVIYSAFDSQGNKGVCIFSFEVEVITCTPVDWPRNGIKNCDKSGDIYGTTCTFQCNDGYELNGNAVVTCGQNGLYSGNAPSCEKLYCTQRFQDNFLLYTCPNNKFTYGSSCTLSCFGTYPLVGNSTIVCDKDENSYPTVGVWRHGSNTEPFCRRNSCPDLTPPLNGALACDTVGVNKFCQMLCNAQYDIPRTAQASEYYVCGDSGTWSMTSVPDCTQARRPNMMLLPGEIYYFTGDCNNADVVDQIKINFVKLMEQLTQTWTGICPSTGCTTSTVEVTCGAVSGRKKKDTYNMKFQLDLSDKHDITKRQTHQIVVKFNINMDWIFTNLSAADEFNHNDAEIIKFFNNVIQPLITSGNLTVENYTATSAVYGWTEMGCPTGQVPRYTTVTCAGCPIGTFFNSTRNDCQNCTVGTYQDEEFQVSCKPCPSGTMTEGVGAKNVSKCIDICDPGHYSYTGYEPCFPCPIGYYQPNEMSTSCLRCNDSHTTTILGSNSSSQCLDGDHIYELLHFRVSIDTRLNISRSTWIPLAITWDSTVGQLSVFKKGILDYSTTLSSLQSTPINNGSSLIFMSSSGTKAGWKIDGFVFHGTVLNSSNIDTLSKTCSPAQSGAIYTMEAFRLASASKIDLISPSLCSVVDHCDPNPCGQFSCLDRTTGYTCECNEGYTGINCQTPPDYCANNNCANGASCEAGTNNYTCLCIAGYNGIFCEHQIVNGSWSAWGPWSSECLPTCNIPTRNRTRICDNPPPDPDGAPCEGVDSLEEACPCQACPSFSTVKEEGNEYNCSSEDGYDICVVTCSAGLTFASNYDNVTYSCGQNTSYEWNVKPPKCLTQESPKRVGLTVRGKYSSFQCSYQEEARQNLTNKIISDSEIQCVKNNTCSVNVTISGCNSTTDVTDVIASIELYTQLQGGDNLNMASKIENDTESAGYTALKMAMEEMKLTHTQVDMMTPDTLFAINVEGNHLITSTYELTTEMICQPGAVSFQSVCVECPSGTYQSNLQCQYCGKGTYQPITKQTSCISCPTGYTTLFTGSKSPQDCFESNDTTTVSTTSISTQQQQTDATMTVHSTKSTTNPPSDTVTVTTQAGISNVTTMSQLTSSHSTTTNININRPGSGIHYPNNRPFVPTTTSNSNTSDQPALIGIVIVSVVAVLGFIGGGYLFLRVRKQIRMRYRDPRNARSPSVASLNMVRPDSSLNCRPGSAASISGIGFESSQPPYSTMPSVASNAVPPIRHMSENAFSKRPSKTHTDFFLSNDDIKMVKEFDQN